jgi:hypothetical protein
LEALDTPSRLMSAFLVVLLISTAVLAAFVRDLTWPASAWLVGTTAAYLAVRRSSRPWLVAARTVLLPSALGFGLLTACLLAYNLLLDPTGPSGSARVARVELQLIDLWKLSRRVSLSGLAMVGILVLLIALARWRPVWRPVSRFLEVQRFTTGVAAMLATFTSFSFFTNTAMSGRLEDRALQRLTVVYVGLRNEEREQLGRYMAVLVVERALQRLSDAERQYLIATLRRIDTMPSLAEPAKRELARHVGARHALQLTGDAAGEPGGGQAKSPPDLATAESEELRRDPEGRIEARTHRAAAAGRLMKAEMHDALNRMGGAVLGLAGEGVLGLLGAFIEPAVDLQASLVADRTKHYFEEVTDTRLEKFIEPYVEGLTRIIKRGVGEEIGQGRSPEMAAAATVETAMEALHLERPKVLVEREQPRRERPGMSEFSGVLRPLDPLWPTPDVEPRYLGSLSGTAWPAWRGTAVGSGKYDQAFMNALETVKRDRERRDAVGRAMVRHWESGRPRSLMERSRSRLRLR